MSANTNRWTALSLALNLAKQNAISFISNGNKFRLPKAGNKSPTSSKPKLTKYITGHPETSGITNYLAGNINIEDIILPTELSSNLFYIPSGPVPPNPAELLMSKRLDALMEHLKSTFDTILIDTPPVGLVADALLLNKHIDSTLFVVRFGQTKRGQLGIIDDIYRNQKLKNTGIVFNGLKAAGGGYGYGYGYGYYDDDKKEKRKKGLFKSKK
ncbi:MAG: polysaccharide biosynthesis tyrosine autokinase [Saprospiraceae bacterium]|nr:MAG: polysaccharide biosynthesis tyrosine autokinase [Saprospiraceae bacterium]